MTLCVILSSGTRSEGSLEEPRVPPIEPGLTIYFVRNIVKGMFRKLDGVMLSSQDTKKLATFYREKVGLDQTGEYEMGEDGNSAFEFGKVQFFINPHDKVRGKNKNPERFMLNFEVDDIKKTVTRLKKNKVRLIQDIYHIEGYGYIATFADLDGNYFQLVQVRAGN